MFDQLRQNVLQNQTQKYYNCFEPQRFQNVNRSRLVMQKIGVIVFV
jgi:hypothetical protein